ncbi:lectin C-type domain protein [Ancylostoma duodenale]|uniref:Lectin C-type domain protein n=1 Tax=Ancylostoma duodenale TaxID=51022 RepID=A0A0C2CWR5_9BILA|nr:lectin C-type domain protein [Ancylostoma duodenale]
MSGIIQISIAISSLYIAFSANTALATPPIYLSSDAKTFLEAEEICKTKKGHLASIHSDEENEFVGTFIKKGAEKVWLGMAIDQDKNMTWTDGSAVDFVNWFYVNADGTKCDVMASFPTVFAYEEGATVKS